MRWWQRRDRPESPPPPPPPRPVLEPPSEPLAEQVAAADPQQADAGMEEDSEEYEEALELSDGDLDYAMFRENHRFQIPEECHWKDVRETTVNVGLAIEKALHHVYNIFSLHVYHRSNNIFYRVLFYHNNNLLRRH